MTDELKPCPFCGHKEIDPRGWASADKHGPACDWCGATAETEREWNLRTEHPADDSEQVTIDWLNTLYRVPCGPLSMLSIRLGHDGLIYLMAPGKQTEGIGGISDYVSPKPATRGDVRRLCAALGVEITEGATR